MPTFKNGNVEIAYLDEGEGDPIVLVHGFASNKEVNWVMPGWTATLRRDGPPRHRAGQSRPRPVGQALRPRRLPYRHHGGRCGGADRDLKLPRADVMGYSLGARIGAVLAARHPELIALADPGRRRHLRLIDSAACATRSRSRSRRLSPR